MTKAAGEDELWGEFLKEFEKQNAPHEPSADERARAAVRRRRRWPWFALIACLLAAGGGAYGLGYPHPARSTARAVKPAAPAESVPKTARPAVVSAAVTPAQAFPAAVGGYARVADIGDASCTGAGSVRPTLAGMITRSHGCAGLDFALYKDSSKNEYSLAVFTMKDPADAMAIVTALGENATDCQAAVPLPPANSGLRALPPSSGLVQSFASSGHLVVVGMAQWSDGHSSNYEQLEQQLSPLLETVAKQAEKYDQN